MPLKNINRSKPWHFRKSMSVCCRHVIFLARWYINSRIHSIITITQRMPFPFPSPRTYFKVFFATQTFVLIPKKQSLIRFSYYYSEWIQLWYTHFHRKRQRFFFFFFFTHSRPHYYSLLLQNINGGLFSTISGSFPRRFWGDKFSYKAYMFALLTALFA